jgi:hypothetical protein
MKNLRKTDCCWNCDNASISLYYDDVYRCRCTVNADKRPSPENPILEGDGEYDEKRQMAFYKAEEVWENERPEVSYGDICDLFVSKSD